MYISTKKVLLEGYDPVSYTTGEPQKGSAIHQLSHNGIHYHFASEKNLETFKANPEKYEPAYGGWCAWAMYSSGEKTEADPLSYEIVDGKLLVFFKNFFANTRSKWNKRAKKEGHAPLVKQADENWQKITM